MDREKEKENVVKVVDRRRFDSTGEERGEAAQPETETGQKSSTKSSTSGEAARMEPRSQKHEDAMTEDKSKEFQGTMVEGAEEGEEQISFSSFVISLATQALMQLGQIQPPPGVQVAKDKEAARQTIEILTMLDKKTRASQDPEEMKLMEEILHNLRLSYVRA